MGVFDGPKMRIPESRLRSICGLCRGLEERPLPGRVLRKAGRIARQSGNPIHKAVKAKQLAMGRREDKE